MKNFDYGEYVRFLSNGKYYQADSKITFARKDYRILVQDDIIRGIYLLDRQVAVGNMEQGPYHLFDDSVLRIQYSTDTILSILRDLGLHHKVKADDEHMKYHQRGPHSTPNKIMNGIPVVADLSLGNLAFVRSSFCNVVLTREGGNVYGLTSGSMLSSNTVLVDSGKNRLEELDMVIHTRNKVSYYALSTLGYPVVLTHKEDAHGG